MKTIYIGTNFNEIRLRPKGTFSFDNEPYVVLFNKQAKAYYAADDYVENEDGSYDVGFSADVTKNMIPGVYTLEVYADTDKENMLKREENYATAIVVAASPDQTNGSQSNG